MTRESAVLPVPWVKPTRRGLRVEIPARFASYVPVLLGVWLIAWAAAEIFIVLAWAGAIPVRIPATPVGIAFFFLGFTAAGVFIAWRLAWVLKGREVVELKDGVLSISRGIGRPRSFSWDLIHDLRMGSYRRRVIYPSWGRRFVGKGDAYIAFRHGGRRHLFGRGLSSGEARELLELLRAHAAGAVPA